MYKPDPKRFHKIYGKKTTRMDYHDKDYADYIIMSLLTALVAYACYGLENILGIAGIVLSLIMIVVFPMRHGFKLTIPHILKHPHEVVLKFVYQIQNMMPVYFIAIGVLLLENYFVYLTPDLPHHTETMREVAFWLLYLHFAGITIYRTRIFVVHLMRKEKCHEFLMQTVWKRQLRFNDNMTLEVFHAYFTGLLSHILLIAPWYLVISHTNYSLVFMPVAIIANFFTGKWFLKIFNDWVYRDHWIGHHNAFDFLYFHGPHHDAIPSGMIAVSGNGPLEGFMRHAMGVPAPFYHPLTAVLAYSSEVQGDMQGHQFIPGMYPKADIQFQKMNQHSMHHFGMIFPLSMALKTDQPDVNLDFHPQFKYLPDEMRNGVRIDEALDNYKWDNPRYNQYLDLIGQYEEQ